MVMNQLAKRIEIQRWQFARFNQLILTKPLPRAECDFRKRTAWVCPGVRVQPSPPAPAFAGGVIARFLTISTCAKTARQHTTP